MTFPPNPTCHGGASVWRAARENQPFRTCDYCGCIHPEDLLAAIAVGSHVGGSDWKYGWPHKFYVEVVNSETPSDRVPVGEKTEGFDEPCPHCCGPDGNARPNLLFLAAKACSCRGSLRRTERTPIMGTRPTFHGKWYNEHLLDEGFDEEALARLTVELERTSGILFTVETVEGQRKLRYHAPYAGYQR